MLGRPGHRGLSGPQKIGTPHSSANASRLPYIANKARAEATQIETLQSHRPLLSAAHDLTSGAHPRSQAPGQDLSPCQGNVPEKGQRQVLESGQKRDSSLVADNQTRLPDIKVKKRKVLLAPMKQLPGLPADPSPILPHNNQGADAFPASSVATGVLHAGSKSNHMGQEPATAGILPQPRVPGDIGDLCRGSDLDGVFDGFF